MSDEQETTADAIPPHMLDERPRSAVQAAADAGTLGDSEASVRDLTAEERAVAAAHPDAVAEQNMRAAEKLVERRKRS